MISVTGSAPPDEVCTWPLNTTGDGGVLIVQVNNLNLKDKQRDDVFDKGTLILPGMV